jgi:O-antigen/teichoic acid export membrane protein
MIRIRRALLFTSAERYTNLVVNFVLISIVSRLLSPAEIGISIVGATIVGIIEILRDIPSPYLVQEKELGRDDAPPPSPACSFYRSSSAWLCSPAPG